MFGVTLYISNLNRNIVSVVTPAFVNLVFSKASTQLHMFSFSCFAVQYLPPYLSSSSIRPLKDIGRSPFIILSSRATGSV